MFVQKNAKRHFCFFAGWFDVPASVVVGNPLAVHLQAELGNLTAVDAVVFTWLIKVLDPVFNLLVFSVLCWDSDDSFFPHGLFLLYRHLDCRDEGVFAGLPIGVACLYRGKACHADTLFFEGCEGFDEA